MKCNINDYALVTLTETAREYCLAQYVSSGLSSAQAARLLSNHEVGDGRHRFQIWDLMNIFGEHMYEGSPRAMFEGNAIQFKAT